MIAMTYKDRVENDLAEGPEVIESIGCDIDEAIRELERIDNINDNIHVVRALRQLEWLQGECWA